MDPQFIFVVCQNGVESICKQEILDGHSSLKFAFSRPGFLTFKCEPNALPEKFILKSTFARTCGWSLSSLKSADFEPHAAAITAHPQTQTARHIHVWQRDLKIPGSGGFKPGRTVLADEVGNRLADVIEKHTASGSHSNRPIVNRNAKADELVFDVAMIEPDHWFAGYHYAQTKAQRWPGGTPELSREEEPLSRAYFKLQEALLWSGIHIQQGDVCAEIGSSPGGASQLLLEKGAHVIAIDPAEMDESLLANPNLVHHRCRGKEVRKKELKEVKWLLSDLNAAPQYTIDGIEEMVNSQHINKIKGVVLTLKLTDLEMAGQIQDWVSRIKKLGFQLVKTRQLAFNRREICLVAARDKFVLRSSRKQK